MPMTDHDIPINVIILENFESNKDELINGYIEILKTCKKAQEFHALFEMIFSEVREITLREVLTKDIANKAKILEETKRS